MKSEFEVAFSEIAELRALPRDIVLEALSQALVSAYRRDAGIGNSQRIEASLDPNTGRPRIFVEKEVVDEVQDKRTEVSLETARYYEPEVQLGDMAMVRAEGSTKQFGRIAAQTAKQVILQKIREAERKNLFDEFSAREGEVTNATVQSVNGGVVTVNLGRTEAVMPRAQQIPGERYKPHDKVRIYILEVKNTNKGPQIIVSRSHRNMLRRLLEFEVPEIYNGLVEIKSIAREAGYRSKVAVVALQDGIDPVGACVGQGGRRIQSIVKELHDEKIDVIEWNPNQEQFISKALSPATVSRVFLDDDPDAGRTAIVIVPDDYLSLAIGREGQNARLAAKLTGWRIDIKSVSETIEEALANLDSPSLRDLRDQQPEVIEEVRRIMDKLAAKRAVMPEEFKALERFADSVQRRYMQAREAARAKRIAEFNAVRATLPQGAFTMAVESLNVPESIADALQPLGNVGEIMVRFLIDENRIRNLLNNNNAAVKQLQDALDELVIPEVEEVPVQPEDEEPVEDPAVAEVNVEPLAAIAEDEAVDFRDAFTDTVEPESQKPREHAKYAPAPERQAERFDSGETLEEDRSGGTKKGKKKKGRQLIFDEKKGGMVTKRNRKRRPNDGWGNDDWDI